MISSFSFLFSLFWQLLHFYSLEKRVRLLRFDRLLYGHGRSWAYGLDSVSSRNWWSVHWKKKPQNAGKEEKFRLVEQYREFPQKSTCIFLSSTWSRRETGIEINRNLRLRFNSKYNYYSILKNDFMCLNWNTGLLEYPMMKTPIYASTNTLSQIKKIVYVVVIEHKSVPPIIPLFSFKKKEKKVKVSNHACTLDQYAI